MKRTRLLAVLLALCLVLSLGAYASGAPDTSQGGRATSAPPDNSTRPINLLGTRAALFIEYSEENGYAVSGNVNDHYEVAFPEELTTPAIGQKFTLDGVYIACSAEDWDEENALGNSGIVINCLTDTTTPFVIGGAGDRYVAPDGEMYNTVIVMKQDENEVTSSGATETAPGTGIAFNGQALEVRNAYVESNGSGRPAIHIPSSTRDKNVKQLSDLIVVDSRIVDSGTRAMLLMGGDVWFLNSLGSTSSWGALSYDNTSTTMYVVNSVSENTGAGGYSIYDAAGCTAYVYGSYVTGGGTGITVCRTATLTIDDLSAADEVATAPYDGEIDLLVPRATDGRTVLTAYDYPIKMHADMSGADSVATAYLNNAYISSMPEDVVFSDGTVFVPDERDLTTLSGLQAEYESGALIDIACHNGKVVFDNCELASRTGVLVHSMFKYDPMASGIYPVDGAEYAGDEIVFANMSAVGDILHEDYMRKMVLSLENAELTGRVYGGTLAGWNNKWTAVCEALSADEEELASNLTRCVYNDTYETLWGVRMSMDAASVWNVTETSNLRSFVMEPGAVVQGADGAALTIYVNCGMDNAAEEYDTSVGTVITAFEPGVEYSGVVIEVAGGAPAGDKKDDGMPASDKKDEGVPAAGGASVEEAYVDYIHEWLLAELEVNGSLTIDQIEDEFMPLVKAGDYESFPADMLFSGMLESGVAMTFEEFAAQYGSAAAPAADGGYPHFAEYVEYVAGMIMADDYMMNSTPALEDAYNATTPYMEPFCDVNEPIGAMDYDVWMQTNYPGESFPAA